MTRTKILSEEERLKECVYRSFDEMTSRANSDVNREAAEVNRGAFEDQSAFMVHGQLSEAKKRRHEAEMLVRRLYFKPYFSHIEASFKDEKDNSKHYFLSDNENLDRMVPIGAGIDGFLVPFKRDADRPISKALFSCYQSKKGKPEKFDAPGGVQTLIPSIICDTDIENRQLLSVIPLFPVPEDVQMSFDEMLDSRLQENRDNPMLRNIISTLQLRQFEIIGADANESFVVQGCAGSGKSQCLLHRLFFLRDELSEEGWEKVLLLTPTKLFRAYSAGLMRRYQLSDITNYSIADLYRQLLDIYDERFKDRQYMFELTEEYLPDDYLHAVYTEENVRKIETEIEKAISKYYSAGAKVMGEDIPDRITAQEIDGLKQVLDESISRISEKDDELKTDNEYTDKRNAYETLTKEADRLKKNRARLQDELETILEKERVLEKYVQDVEDARNERKEWVELRDKRISEAIAELEVASRRVERGTDLKAPAKYARQLYLAQSITSGEKYKSDEEELEILNELVLIAESELKSVVGAREDYEIIQKNNKRIGEIQTKIIDLTEEIQRIEGQIDTEGTWLRQRAGDFDDERNKNSLLLDEIRQARYFLSRIESTVFEREVWNALAPIKEKYSIQTIKTEEIKGGRHKETRILYKSDLMFYLMIYTRLYPGVRLPEYKHICVDEGQDLHRADYELLRKLYPDAVFNVFGDVDQVLHISCGISDWRSQTGLETVYELNTNYRNTATIVDFCNRQFGIEMSFVGNVKKEKAPVTIGDGATARKILSKTDAVVIVKDRTMYLELCKETGFDPASFRFLDTNSDKTDSKSRECYSIFAAKGLEFSNVFVYAKGMTKNQRVVACTRAMGGLYYYE